MQYTRAYRKLVEMSKRINNEVVFDQIMNVYTTHICNKKSCTIVLEKRRCYFNVTIYLDTSIDCRKEYNRISHMLKQFFAEKLIRAL